MKKYKLAVRNPVTAALMLSLVCASSVANAQGGAPGATDVPPPAAASQDHAAVLAKLGDALEAAGEHDQAVATYQKAAKAYMAQGAALTKEAEALRAAGKDDEATAKNQEATAQYSLSTGLWQKVTAILRKGAAPGITTAPATAPATRTPADTTTTPDDATHAETAAVPTHAPSGRPHILGVLVTGSGSATISKVVSGLPGEHAGLQIGDQILEFNHHKVLGADSFVQLVKDLPASQSVIKVLRHGKTLLLPVEFPTRTPPDSRTEAPPTDATPAPADAPDDAAPANDSVAPGLATRTLKLFPLKAKPHLIIGQAVFEDGRPVPNFVVNAAGFNGKFDVMLNVREGATSFGVSKGSNGYYELQVESSHLDPQGKRDPNEDALIFSVRAKTTLSYNGTIYGIELHPLDGVRNGTGEHDFRGQMSRGIVRNFVVKISGLKPGYTADKYPDHGIDLAGSQSSAAYYGGGLSIDCSNELTPNDGTSLIKTFPKASTVTLTLVPTKALLDGSPGRSIRRSCVIGTGIFIYGIPYGVYTATAQLSEPNGTIHNLQWRKKGYDYQEPLADSLLVQWTPLVNEFDKSGELIHDPQLYLFQGK